jgi:hypothetical protein
MSESVALPLGWVDNATLGRFELGSTLPFSLRARFEAVPVGMFLGLTVIESLATELYMV